MAQFGRFGALDDPLAVSGDRAFLRINQRLEPWQLQPGEVTVSENARMDRGVWQPRKGIKNISGALQVSEAPLRVPFFLVDTAGGETITSATRTDETVTVTKAGHGFTVGAEGYLGIESLTGSEDPNGVQYVTIADGDTFTFELDGATGSETYGGTGKYRSVIDDNAAAEIIGSCLYSDPNSSNNESILIAGNGAVTKVNLADSTTSTVAYPTSLNYSGAVEMVQAFDRVFLFQGGQRPIEWFPLDREIEGAARATNVVTITVSNHGLTVGDSVTVADVNFSGDDPNGTFSVASIVDADNFTYSDTGADETFTVDDDSLLTSGFTYVAGGTYSQPQVFQATGTNVTCTDGLVSVTVSGNTTIKEGDRIKIFQSTSDDFLDFVGSSATAVSASSTTITFYLPVRDLTTIGSETLDIGRNVSVGGGFSHMPAPPWAIYHQRRFICPYRYTVAGSAPASTYTDRKVRDELVISDILDPDTFDVLANQYRITAGIADFLVGCWPFYEDTLLVFNRNSIHGVFGISGALNDTSVKELTREIGCVARKSIAQHGAEILFLSDNGVYGVSFIDEYNLRGVDTPLSEPIQPVIDRINADLAANAVGVYFANRYYLALPLDSEPGANDATGNNSILVYNFLNQGWESVDSVNDSRWNIINFHIGRAGERNDLYAVNDFGGVHLIDGQDNDSDELAIVPGESIQTLPVNWRFRSRQYDGGDPGRKRWTRVQLQVETSNLPAEGSLSFYTEDPDGNLSLGDLSSHVYGVEQLASMEDYSIRARIGGRRGHGGEIEVSTGFGRPKIKSLAVEGTLTNRSTVSQV